MRRRYILREANETAEQRAMQYLKRGLISDNQFKDYIRRIQTYIDADPTSENGRCGKYVDWLVDNYDDLKYIISDDAGYSQDAYVQSQIRDMLTRFIRSKQKIVAAGHSANIQTYDAESFFDLIVTLQKGAGWDSGMKKMEQQYKIIANTQKSVVVEPLTWQAERYFGQHTQWCTVGALHHWEDYSHDGHIFIVIPKDGNGYPDLRSEEKWQCSYSMRKGVNCADNEDNTYTSLFELFDESGLNEDSEAVASIGCICPQIANTAKELDSIIEMFAEAHSDRFYVINPYSCKSEFTNGTEYITTKDGEVWGVAIYDEAIDMMAEQYVEGMGWSADEFDVDYLSDVGAIQWRKLFNALSRNELNGREDLQQMFEAMIMSNLDGESDIESFDNQDYAPINYVSVEDEETEEQLRAELYQKFQGDSLIDIICRYEDECVDWHAIGMDRAQSDAEYGDFCVLGTDDKYLTADDGYQGYVFYYTGDIS